LIDTSLIAIASTLVSLSAVGASLYAALRKMKNDVQIQREKLHSDERAKLGQMLREKGEDLYITLGDIELGFRNSFSEIAKRIGKTSNSDAFSAGNLNDVLKQLLKIEMLVRVYFPKCAGSFEMLHANVEKRGSVFLAGMKSERENTYLELQRQLMSLGADISESIQQLQADVVQSLRLTHDDFTRHLVAPSEGHQ